MNPILIVIGVLVVLGIAGAIVVGPRVRRAITSRGMDRWFPAYQAQRAKRKAAANRSDTHLILCIADHYEPAHHAKSPEEALARVKRWLEEYPRQFGQFRDRDGRPPRHTFFFPLEQYDEAQIETLVELCRQGYGEIEVHLHHHDDTSENVRRCLSEFRDLMTERHGQLATRKSDGARMYAFIHGNWTLDNSHPAGKHCGVNDEIDILVETGCYVDMTMPSMNPSQTRTINSIYYVNDDPAKPFSHDTGAEVEAGRIQPVNSLMLIQGPLVLDWVRKIRGLIPRVENGCLQKGQTATMQRVDNWVRAGVSVASRPDWAFVKLHAHGGDPKNIDMMLGEPTKKFHQALADRMASDPHFHVHYVTAREMYNLARAAEAGWTGSIADARDFELVWNHDLTLSTTPRPTVGGLS